MIWRTSSPGRVWSVGVDLVSVAAGINDCVVRTGLSIQHRALSPDLFVAHGREAGKLLGNSRRRRKPKREREGRAQGGSDHLDVREQRLGFESGWPNSEARKQAENEMRSYLQLDSFLAKATAGGPPFFPCTPPRRRTFRHPRASQPAVRQRFPFPVQCPKHRAHPQPAMARQNPWRPFAIQCRLYHARGCLSGRACFIV